MFFPSLDGSLGCVSAMVARGGALEGDFAFLESLVEDARLGRAAVAQKLFMKFGPGFGELASLATFEGRGESGVGVAVAERRDATVAARRLDRELACLVGVRFFELG